uniref:Uncharacterized protein n=1 Tax=Triticum urartu TaxID=4572 RepID=A0A8R7P4I4_TRIUA
MRRAIPEKDEKSLKVLVHDGSSSKILTITLDTTHGMCSILLIFVYYFIYVFHLRDFIKFQLGYNKRCK